MSLRDHVSGLPIHPPQGRLTPRDTRPPRPPALLSPRCLLPSPPSARGLLSLGAPSSLHPMAPALSLTLGLSPESRLLPPLLTHHPHGDAVASNPSATRCATGPSVGPRHGWSDPERLPPLAGQQAWALRHPYPNPAASQHPGCSQEAGCWSVLHGGSPAPRTAPGTRMPEVVAGGRTRCRLAPVSAALPGALRGAMMDVTCLLLTRLLAWASPPGVTTHQATGCLPATARQLCGVMEAVQISRKISLTQMSESSAYRCGLIDTDKCPADTAVRRMGKLPGRLLIKLPATLSK
uniref:Uncharacterized protein n=1 Tax=Myotis myotis TaxID=51298 RepID=A0A7J7SCE6_MYOMY|nr:hypothetical protein mMyoMyo1_009545 [Myotis myotis]